MQRWNRLEFYKGNFIYLWPWLDSPVVLVGRAEKPTAWLTQIVENNSLDISQIALIITSQLEKCNPT